MVSLYDNPDLYDLISPPDAEMEAFYVIAAKANGPRVLDLACGTGRFTLPLAEAGLEATGADLAEPMLARLHVRAAERRVTVETLVLDMRSFALAGRTFDTIMIAANSIMHLLTADDFRSFFASVGNHLAPGGRLLFDCFVPSAILLGKPGVRQPMTTAVHPNLGEVTIDEIIDYDPITQISHTKWFWSTPAQPDFHVTPLALRQIFPEELPLLLAANGFRLLERFGDFDRSPLAAGHYRQVCVATPN